MIKNKDKDELIEFAYSLIAENKMLLDEIKLLSKKSQLRTIIDYITYPITWAITITQYRLKLKDMRVLTRQELIDTFNVITKYENKQYSRLVYKDLFTNVTGIKFCSTCGTSLDRMHNDFQRVVLSQVKTVCPDIVPNIQLYSGKYSSSDFYMDSIPFNTFTANEVILNKMKAEHKQFKSKGYLEQTSLLELDINTLSAYILARKEGSVSDEVNVPEFEALKPVLVAEEVIVPVEVIDIAELPTVVDFKVDLSDEVVEDEVVVDVMDKEPQTPSFDVEKAYKMKQKGMSNTEIGAYFDVAYQFVSKQLKGYMPL